MLPLAQLLQPDTWTDALDKYGAATRLTTVIFNPALERVLGPVHTTALFDAAAGPTIRCSWNVRGAAWKTTRVP